ncbi:hypothetical protein ACFWEO_01725 [Streptomyces roseolus]|uniref:hypothetical protein n=1 Tax=Streptomyces roseolus TaxID=67358 RepID=UPI0036537C57
MLAPVTRFLTSSHSIVLRRGASLLLSSGASRLHAASVARETGVVELLLSGSDC